MENMKKIVKKLNEAASAYYNTGNEIMSNKEYDELYCQLVNMEQQTGIILPDSPTKKVGAEVVSSLPKEKHEFPALSLSKTKDISEFPELFYCRDGIAIAMYKMDGCTGQATYDDGRLTKLVTRGNGFEGSIITHNAPYIKGLPMKIPYKGHLVVRGELCMSYKEFERIIASLPEGEEPYKNPRNLANATVSMLDSREMRKREIWFHAFKLIYCEDKLQPNTFTAHLNFLNGWGFNVVDHIAAFADGTENFTELTNAMQELTNCVKEFPFPVDGLVVAANDVVYAEEQPGTSHHPNKLVGYAFKWEDVSVQTTLREIEWSASRTGLLNPVAVFDPVEIEGTTVSRASLHNLSYIMSKDLRIGDKITVYKANMIIPQIAENLSTNEERQRVKISSAYLPLETKCPICNDGLSINTSEDGETLTVHCINPNCPAKMVGKFVHFCERDCMDIADLSEATIEKFVEKGFIKEYADIFQLERFKEEITSLEGFGEKSFNNLITATEKARHTSFVPFIHSLGIPGIGQGHAKLLNKEYKGDVMQFFKDAQAWKHFQYIDGIGEVLEDNIWKWANNYLRFVVVPEAKGVNDEIKNLMPYLTFEHKDAAPASTKLKGLTFVITGSVEQFSKRDELQNFIEANGGKTSGSVSAKTSYLINNDVTSTSGKNKKAKELGIPIISEEQFLNMLKE